MSTGWPAWAQDRDTRDGRAWPVDPVAWDGPAWAAPEHVERWACRPSPVPVLDSCDHVVIGCLFRGSINPFQFQTAWAIALKSRAETSNWTEEDWQRWERENPEPE